MKLLSIGIVVVLNLLCCSLAEAQPVATSDQSIGWDYTDAQIAAGQVTRFEGSFDGGAFLDLGMSRVGTTDTYFVPIPATVTGNHTFAVRACNADFCSTATPFTYRLGVLPSDVDGATIRIIPTPVP